MNDKKRIKAEIRKQLKMNISGWNGLSKKEKRSLSQAVLAAVKERYDNGTLSEFTSEELLTLQPLPKDIMSIDQAQALRKQFNTDIAWYMDGRQSCCMGTELAMINDLLNDHILNHLLRPPGYTPSKRLKTPAMFFRAELLKSLYCAEMSYRKFCDWEINDLERKKNRTFIGLPLRKKVCISHSELSTFRHSVTFSQQLNVLVYILSLLFDATLVGDHHGLFGVDGSDLAAKVNTHPLATITVTLDRKKEKISIYSQPEVDCGERRDKGDKSKYFVGYKMHALSVINPETGMAYSLFSLLAPANHHDNNFLEPLIALGKAMGLDMKLIVADEGYDSTNVELMERYEVTVATSPRSRVNHPVHVDSVDGKTQVFCHEYCPQPMEYVGRDGEEHEYHCSDDHRKCPFRMTCPQSRMISLDNGLFGPIPQTMPNKKELISLRKVIERPFNYMKHRNGIDRITVKSQHSAQFVTTIATIAVLLIELAGQRKEKHYVNNQYELMVA